MRYCEENKVFFKLNGDKIRELRTARDLSQTELATDLCMQQCQISQIERNKEYRPRYDTVMMFADYFGVNINDLIIKEYAK